MLTSKLHAAANWFFVQFIRRVNLKRVKCWFRGCQNFYLRLPIFPVAAPTGGLGEQLQAGTDADLYAPTDFDCFRSRRMLDTEFNVYIKYGLMINHY
jgi:hypothetical protein